MGFSDSTYINNTKVLVIEIRKRIQSMLLITTQKPILIFIAEEYLTLMRQGPYQQILIQYIFY